MINNEVRSIKSIAKLSLLRSAALLAMAIVVFLFYTNPVHSQSDIFVVLLFGVIYIMISTKYFQEQIKLWKYIPKFRFVSWYYISFSIVWIVVLFALSIIAYFLFDNITLSLAAFIFFVAELAGLYVVYSKSLHFIAVKPNHIMITKKKIKILVPEEIAEIHYRNDILIFKLKNEQTIFVNFLETENARSLRPQIAEWMKRNQLFFHEIINELSKKSLS